MGRGRGRSRGRGKGKGKGKKQGRGQGQGQGLELGEGWPLGCLAWWLLSEGKGRSCLVVGLVVACEDNQNLHEVQNKYHKTVQVVQDNEGIFRYNALICHIRHKMYYQENNKDNPK